MIYKHGMIMMVSKVVTLIDDGTRQEYIFFCDRFYGVSLDGCRYNFLLFLYYNFFLLLQT